VVSAVSQRWLVMVAAMLTKRFTGLVAVLAVALTSTGTVVNRHIDWSTGMGIRTPDKLLFGGISTVGGVRRGANADAGPDSTAAASGPPGALDVSIRRRGNVVELSLSGALDVAGASRLGEAMALARDMASTRGSVRSLGTRGRHRGHTATIVIDTSDIHVVDSAGYEALRATLVAPNGLWDPGVSLVVGPAVATFEASIDQACERRRRSR
jgi:hypothetical protein